MSWENQPRDSKGRFLPKTVVPVKTTTKRKANKKLTQVNVFVIDDSGSITNNGMTDSIKQGMDKIIDDVTSENKDQMFWGLSMFGKYSNKHYAFGNTPLRLVNYNPSQWATALYDGIGYAIENTIQYITKIKLLTQVLYLIFSLMVKKTILDNILKKQLII